MFRSLSEDDGGFVNDGLEISEDICVNGRNKEQKQFTFNGDPSTKIEITRTKYDQQKLHDSACYKKPPSKSSECLCS